MDNDQANNSNKENDLNKPEPPCSPSTVLTSEAYLNKKTRRQDELLFDIRDKKCDFCLENLVHSDTKLLECCNCLSSAHHTCIQKYSRSLSIRNDLNWLCMRCSEAKSLNRRFEAFR